MKINKYLVLICNLFLWYGVHAQSNVAPGIASEIVPSGRNGSKHLSLLPPSSQAIKSGGNGKIDIDEVLYYQIRNSNTGNPVNPLPFASFVKQVSYIIRFKNDVYGPFVVDSMQLPSFIALSGSRFTFTARGLLGKVKTEVLDKLNSRNINDLQIIIQGLWYTNENLTKDAERNSQWKTKEEVEADFKAKGITDSKKLADEIRKNERIRAIGIRGSQSLGINPIIAGKTQTDVFTLTVLHFGLIALVDVSPLSKDGAQLSLDVVSGLFKNLSRTSLDYVAVSKKHAFSNVMVSVPVLKYEGRSWVADNVEVEGVLAMDLEDRTKPVGYGVGLGLLGEKDKGLKIGGVWQDGNASLYFGVSIRGLAAWLSNYK